MIKLPHIFHKSLLVRHAGELAVSEDADVPQTEFHETLVDEIHRRVYVESHRRLSRYQSNIHPSSHRRAYRVDISSEVLRIWTILSIRVIDGWNIRHQTHGRVLFW